MGILSKHDLTNTPWYVATEDLIGPWPTKTEHFHSLLIYTNMCDNTANLVKLICIKVLHLLRNLNILALQIVQDHYVMSLIKVESLQNIPSLASSKN